MKSDKNSKEAFPPLINQLQNDKSQIINYYINLTHNLNMNNVGYDSMFKFPLYGDSLNSNKSQENQNQVLANAALFNTYLNMSNYFNMLQMQASFNQHQQLHSHMNNYQSNQNNKKPSQNLNLVGKKRKMERKKDNKDEINKKTDIIFQNIINVKNGSTQKNKNESNDQLEKTKHSNDVINKIIINQSPAQQNLEIPEKKIDNKTKDNELGDGPKEEKKNIVKRKRNKNKYKELLQDILLEHLDKEKKDISIVIDNSSFKSPKSSSNNKRFQKNNKKNLNFKKSNSVKKEKDKNIKSKSQRCKTNLKSKKKEKNEKSNTVKFQPTEIIFHGDKYEKTKSAIDFMKYNYNFIEELKQPKIGDAKKQTADIDLPRIIYKNNYENNKYNLSDIKPIWLRSKFNGSNTELESKIRLIKDENKDRRNVINEDKCLEKLFENSKEYIKN